LSLLDVPLHDKHQTNENFVQDNRQFRSFDFVVWWKICYWILLVVCCWLFCWVFDCQRTGYVL